MKIVSEEDKKEKNGVGTRPGAKSAAKKRINNALIALKRLENIANPYWDLGADDIKKILQELESQMRDTKGKLSKAISKHSEKTSKEDGPFKGW